MLKILPLNKLPMNYSPLIDNLLLVASNIKEYAYPWILDDYVELMILQDGESFEFMQSILYFWTCPLVYVSRLSRDIFHINEMIFIETLKNYITKDFYIMMIVDTYFIKEYITYQKNHQTHEILLYGYEDDLFCARDYFDFLNPTCNTVRSEELWKAFFAVNAGDDYLRGVLLLKNENLINCSMNNESEHLIFGEKISTDYRITIDGMIKKLENFIYKDNSTIHIPFYNSYYWGYRTGFKAIDIFIDKTVRIVNENQNTVNLKHFHLVYLHTYLMSERVKFINEMYENAPLASMIDIFSNLVEQALVLRNKAIKYNVKKSKENDIINIINKFRNEYYIYIKKLIARLKEIES